MIDLNRIRSIKTLEEIKKDLNAFLVYPDMRAVYLEDLGWSDDDYEADKESVVELLEQVERRLRSLSNYLKGQSTRRGSRLKKKSETVASPSEQ